MALFLASDAYLAILFPAFQLGLLLIFFVILFLSVKKAQRLSAIALPDSFPPEDEPDDPGFGRTSSLYAGSFFKGLKFYFLPLQVWGKGFGGRGNGKIWLSPHSIILRRYLIRTPVVIPYDLILGLEVKKGAMAGGKYHPGPFIVVTWGLEKLPIASFLGVSGGLKVTKAWAVEIARRGNVLRESSGA